MAKKRKAYPEKQQSDDQMELDEFFAADFDDEDPIDNELQKDLEHFFSTATELTRLACEKDKAIQTKEDVFQTYEEAMQRVITSLVNAANSN